MTTLTQLIEHHCPDGVEHVKLGDVAIRQRGIAITAAKMRELDSLNGDIVVFGAGATRALIDSSEIAGTNIHTKDSVIVKARGHVGFEMCTVPFTTKSELWSYRSDDPKLNIRYGYYFLSEHSGELAEVARLNGVKLPQLKVSDTDDYLIPLPPREVQDAIVERLDVFAALIESLDSEIVLREKRFEYFREQLLTFDESDDVEYVKLGDVGSITRGRGLTKKDLRDQGTPAIHYGQIYTYYGDSTSSTTSFVAPELTEKLTRVDPGSAIVACTSENIEDLGKTTVWMGRFPVFTGLHTLVFKHQMEPMYVGHWLRSYSFFKQKLSVSYGTKVLELSAKAFSEIRMPFPPLEVQQDIADKLDTMQALIENLKQERELRKTQFEYYREKLLTFNS